MPKICPLARSSRVGKRAGQDGLAGPATLDGPAAGTRRPPRRRGGLIALVVCEATARRRCVRRRMRLAVRWDGGMVRSGVGVVRDARASKPTFTSAHPAGAPTCCPSAFGGSSSSSRGAFGGGATPLSQPRASCAPICAHFCTRPTLVGEDRPFSASRASSGASSSSGGAFPMLPPAPSWQPARGPHRRPHALSHVVGAIFLRGPRRYGALGDG